MKKHLLPCLAALFLLLTACGVGHMAVSYTHLTLPTN